MLFLLIISDVVDLCSLGSRHSRLYLSRPQGGIYGHMVTLTTKAFILLNFQELKVI